MEFKESVIILEEDAKLRKGLRDLLETRGYAVKLFKTVSDFLEEERSEGVCCLVIGHRLKEHYFGREVQEKVKGMGWELPSIVLSEDWSVRTVVDALRAGADGYVTKPVDPEYFVQEVERALGHARLMRERDQRLGSLKRRAAALTPREKTIVQLVVGGLLNKEIADRLDLAVVTVKVHRGRAMKKLEAGNAAELTHLAVMAGIAEGGDLLGARPWMPLKEEGRQ